MYPQSTAKAPQHRLTSCPLLIGHRQEPVGTKLSLTARLLKHGSSEGSTAGYLADQRGGARSSAFHLWSETDSLAGSVHRESVNLS